MLSHSIALGNNQSELQFISDLINLCNRHKVSCGKPQDLDHLSVDLIFNDAFRTDLFTLCIAISHMAEIQASPEQLLVLVARAFGGPGLSLPDPANDIPHDARSVFLTGYETWSEREPDLDDDLPLPPHENSFQLPLSPPQRPTLYHAAAARFGSEHPETFEDLPVSHPITAEPSHSPVPRDTSLDGLTPNELRMYIEDIERRMRQIELEQFAIRADSSTEGTDRLQDFDGQSVHLAKPLIGAQSIAGVQRLRTVIAVQTFLLIFACASAAIFAYRFLKPQAHSVTTSSTTPFQNSVPSAAPSTSLPDNNAADRANTHPRQQALPPAAAISPSTRPLTLIASIASTHKSDDRPTQSPIAEQDQKPDVPVQVPAAKMMTYAVSAPDPIYPPTRHFGVDSTVAVKTTISREGQVTDAQALTGTPAVRAAALEAVKAWRFKPFIHNGDPVPVVTTFKFFFGSQ